MQTHIIFDLDGTLSDSALLTVEAFRRIAPQVGLPAPAPEAVRRCTGYANPEFYDHLYPDHPRALVRRAGELVEREELGLLPALKEELLFPGCRELLEELKNRGTPLYIASTGSREHVHAVVEKTGIACFFEEICCGQPDKADMIRGILASRDPVSFLMVGDMRKDCEGARANGIRSVGACYGYCLRDKGGFDRYIDRPWDLLELL